MQQRTSVFFVVMQNQPDSPSVIFGAVISEHGKIQHSDVVIVGFEQSPSKTGWLCFQIAPPCGVAIFFVGSVLTTFL